MEPVIVPTHRVRTTFIWIFTITLAFWLVIFLGFFVYYLWQLKFGSEAEVAKTQAEFKSQKFTTTEKTKDGPRAPTDWEKYIYPTSPTIGFATSPITIIEFIDFECPFCQEGYPLFKSVTETYDGAVRIVFKYLPLTSIHPNALTSALAAACAHEQNKFWPYYDYLFATKKLTGPDLTKAASAVGLDINAFSDCLKTQKYRALIEKDVNDAIELGVRGTPTYFIKNEIIEGLVDRTQWDAAILRYFKK